MIIYVMYEIIMSHSSLITHHSADGQMLHFSSRIVSCAEHLRHAHRSVSTFSVRSNIRSEFRSFQNRMVKPSHFKIFNRKYGLDIDLTEMVPLVQNTEIHTKLSASIACTARNSRSAPSSSQSELTTLRMIPAKQPTQIQSPEASPNFRVL